MKKSPGLAVLLAAFSLLALPSFAQQAPRTIAVTGHASIPCTPEFVDLEFAIVTRDPSYAAAQAANLSAVEKSMALLSGKFAMKREDVTTLDWRLQEEPVFDEGRKQGSVYAATTRMRARVRDIGAYRAVVVGLLDAGVNAIDSIGFGVADTGSLREKALVAACQDAERMARAMAAAAKASIVRVTSLRENAAFQGPAPVLLAKATFSEAAGNGQVISSGDASVEASVYVEYEIR